MGISAKRIAFVVLDYPLGVSSQVLNSISLLAERNSVDVIVDSEQLKSVPCEASPKFNLLAVPMGRFRRATWTLVSRSLLWVYGRLGLNAASDPLRWTLGHSRVFFFASALRRILLNGSYDIVISVEVYSLIASQLALGTGYSRVIYFDMELLDWSDASGLYPAKRVLKSLQLCALQAVDHVMITSPKRADAFCEINRFPKEKVSVLPVVPRRRRSFGSSRYFQNKFGIPPAKRIVVYSGNFMPWAKCLEIIRTVPLWPEDAVLVMHTWNKSALNSDYFASLKEAAAGLPVYFSSDFLSIDELVGALSSADVGLFFYESLDANFTEIMFSSNKMGDYLAAGLPVVCSPFESLKAFVNANQIGRAVDISSIPSALGEIFAGLDSFRANVAECRESHFVFERYFEKAFGEFDSQLWRR